MIFMMPWKIYNNQLLSFKGKIMIRSIVCLFILAFSFAANAGSCYESTIQKPSPFMGNNGEIFKLDDGSIWEVKYEYEYMYEYYPDVVICPDKGILIINGKKLNVEQVD